MAQKSSPASVSCPASASVIQINQHHNVKEATATSAVDSVEYRDTSRNATPTLFLDFDGTLHIGHASMDEAGVISLDTGRPLFEFAPFLIDLLKPYPSVQIVLTTSWLITLPPNEAISLLPHELAHRVVGTTRHIKPRLSYLLNGTDRTYVICRYAYDKQLEHWLAVDDSVFGVEQFGHTRGELAEHFLLLDPMRGLSDESALQRTAEWLVEVHC